MEEVAVGERTDTGRELAIQSSPGKPLAHLMEDFRFVASCPLCKLLSGVIESDVILVLLHLNGIMWGGKTDPRAELHLNPRLKSVSH